MKHVKKTLTALATTLVLSSPAFAQDYVIGLSPDQSVDTAKSQIKTLLAFTASREAGDRILYMDALNNTQIGEFIIPEGKAYAKNLNARLKAKGNGNVLKKLLTFVKNATPTSQNSGAIGSVKLPQFLETVTSHHSASEKLDVILLGSPFYFDETDKAFSMRESLVPGDGHLNAPRSVSVFSANTKDKLAGLRVHLAFDESIVFENDRHRYFVQRFWSLFVSEQGGELITFSHDLDGVLNRVASGAKPASNDYQLNDTQRLEMIRFQDVELTTSIYAAPLTEEPLPEDDVTHAQNVTIGLTWNNCSDCDLDLYVKASQEAKALSYQTTQTAEGVYFKDYRDSPKTGFETVELKVPVDLRAMTIMVNFYQGHADDGVSGQIRLAIDKKTYALPFTITATQGNKGQGVGDVLASRKSAMPETLIIDPISIVSP